MMTLPHYPSNSNRQMKKVKASFEGIEKTIIMPIKQKNIEPSLHAEPVCIEESLKYKSYIHHEVYLNLAFYKIFSDYFNIIKQNPKIVQNSNISDITFFRNKSFLSSIDLTAYTGQTDIMFNYENTWINFSFDKYRQSDEYFYTLMIKSEDEVYLRGNDIYHKILMHALSVSNLKGAYIELRRNAFSWTIKDLEPRSFSDIFLPQKLMEDLSLYINVFDKKKRLMRYMMVGNPGTGKTESTLVLSNKLKELGVTIIKTPVDEYLKEKIELAEALSPSIIIFDDLDLSIGSRTSGGYSPKELQMFLDAMDGTDKISKKVGIIATTNSSQLLDLAAQRPGRFEKIMAFDKLTKKNIANIILKSIKYNFDNFKQYGLFHNKKIVDKLFDAGTTGAYIYNVINMIMLKCQMSDIQISEDWVYKELTQELEHTQQLKNKNHMTDTLEKDKKKLGFGEGTTTYSEEDMDPDYTDEFPPLEKIPVPQQSIRTISGDTY